MLQNRVDPQGNIIATPARGSWMGNRGVIHDENKTIVRPFKMKAWLICLLEFKERHRPVMEPNRYTELFFLDEATAFSAGHRPCAECRKKAFNRFKTAWVGANPEYGFDLRTPVWKIDEVLHKERINLGGAKVTHEENRKKIPAGCFIRYQDAPFLYADGLFHRWTPFGYEEGITLPLIDRVEVLTPQSVVKTFRAGYQPQMAIAMLSI